MADAPAFDWVADALERATSFSRIQARGTVRLALKKAGLDAATVSLDEMQLVLLKVMPKELRDRKVERADEICEALRLGVKTAELAKAKPAHETPAQVFGRLFGVRGDEPPRR